MFCPQCNAEYRPGFTRCADCDADLVNESPHFALAGKPPVIPGDPNDDPFCSFWKGQDARVHAELCEVLEQAGIPHKTIFRSDHLFNFTVAFPQLCLRSAMLLSLAEVTGFRNLVLRAHHCGTERQDQRLVARRSCRNQVHWENL